MRKFDEKSRRHAETEAAPLDPIALTLALWLGLVVGVTGLIRLSESAAANAARTQEHQIRPAAMSVLRPMAFSPYGS